MCHPITLTALCESTSPGSADFNYQNDPWQRMCTWQRMIRVTAVANMWNWNLFNAKVPFSASLIMETVLRSWLHPMSLETSAWGNYLQLSIYSVFLFSAINWKSRLKQQCHFKMSTSYIAKQVNIPSLYWRKQSQISKTKNLKSPKYLAFPSKKAQPNYKAHVQEAGRT